MEFELVCGGPYTFEYEYDLCNIDEFDCDLSIGGGMLYTTVGIGTDANRLGGGGCGNG